MNLDAVAGTLGNALAVVLKELVAQEVKHHVEEIKMQANSKPAACTDIKDRAMLLSNGGTLTGSDVCKLNGWSKSTLYRRLNAGEIIMVKDGRDFRMDVNDFLTWHAKNF